MRISDILKTNKVTVSCEMFPPKPGKPLENTQQVVHEIAAHKPSFMSVTYGAGGSAAGATTTELVRHIKENLGTESIAHLTCVNSTHADIDEKIKEFEANGIENVLALRGDINPNFPPKNEFLHASDLIEYMKPRSNLSFSGGCYPEVHPEASSMVEDILHLKKKVDAGASHLISQLFFDNSSFIEFLEKARIAGIDVPIEAGIMPCVNAKSVQRMVSMWGASLPVKFTKMINRYGDNPEAMRDAGIAYAVDQIIDLVARGVDGIHLYTMNNPYVARKITESIEKVIRCDK